IRYLPYISKTPCSYLQGSSIARCGVAFPYAWVANDIFGESPVVVAALTDQQRCDTYFLDSPTMQVSAV
ncbi:MAG: hypothetical protein JSU72_18370, partial [Deltaproteobacteria bacterium]